MTHPSWVTPWPWLSFTELDKAVVHVIILTSFLWLWFQFVCPLMPSGNTYLLTWVSLTLDVGYLFTAFPAKCSHCSLPWMRSGGWALPPDLEHGVSPLCSPAPAQPPLLGRAVAPLGPPAPAQPPLLGHGVAPPGRHPWPQAWGSSVVKPWKDNIMCNSELIHLKLFKKCMFF